MSELSVIPRKIEVATTETNLVYGFDATARLADEGEGVTLASAVATMTDITTGKAAPAAAIVGCAPDSPLANVTLNPSVLTVGQRYRLVCTYTSSESNTEAMEVEVLVPF